MNDFLKELLDADNAFSQLSIQKGTSFAFKKYLINEAVMLPQGKNPQIGKDEIIKAITTSNSNDILSWKPKGGRMSRSNDLGYTWGIYSLKRANGRIIKGKYMNIWTKQKDGSWKVEVDMGNTNE